MQGVQRVVYFLNLLLERLEIELIVSLDTLESRKHENVVFISEQLLESVESAVEYEVGDIPGLLGGVVPLEGGEGDDSVAVGLREYVGGVVLGVLVVVEELVGYLVGLVGVLVERDLVVLGGAEGVVHVIDY